MEVWAERVLKEYAREGLHRHVFGDVPLEHRLLRLLRWVTTAFEIQGMGDDTVLRVAERALQKRGREYGVSELAPSPFLGSAP